MVARRTYKWKTSPRFSLLSLMDLVTVNDAAFPSSPTPVRIIKVKQNADWSIEYEAEPFIYGASVPVQVTSITPVGGTGHPHHRPDRAPGLRQRSHHLRGGPGHQPASADMVVHQRVGRQLRRVPYLAEHGRRLHLHPDRGNKDRKS